jgi:hypothetical protein
MQSTSGGGASRNPHEGARVARREGRNVRGGLEDPRQSAPLLAGDLETRRVWLALAIVVVAFLLCPGCGGGEGGDEVAIFATLGALLLAALAFESYVKRGRRAQAAEDLAESRLELLDEEATRATKAEAKVRGLETRIAEEEAASESLSAELLAVRNLNAGLSADLAHMRARVPADQAALDACAELLDDERDAPGSGVWTKAREALRATGRLGGVTATEPEPATLCRCGHGNADHDDAAHSRRCLAQYDDGSFCLCRALDVMAHAAVQG